MNEDELLISNYGKLSRSELAAFLPNRSWDAIKLHANKLGLVYYDGVHKYVQSDLSRLLDNTPATYYWMGFLMADGYFGLNHLKLTLANRDKNHVVKFSDYISCPNHGRVRGGYGIKVQDGFTIPKIKDKFDIKRAKTYHPPDIRRMSGDLFLSFFIGFVDGDGSIRHQSGRKDCQLQIKIHSSWLENLQWMSIMVAKSAGAKHTKAKINTSGYASVCLANCVVLRFLKNKVVELSLPVLSRKWNKIDETKISRYETAKKNRDAIFVMARRGMRNKDICGELCLSPACVSVILSRFRKENKL